MKKWICILLLMLAACVMISACANTDLAGGANTTTAPELVEQDTTASDTTGPEDNRTILTIGMVKNLFVEDYYNNEYTQWLEEKTGFKLEFQLYDTPMEYHFAVSKQAEENELPDILLGFSKSEEDIGFYTEKGHFVDLSGYFNDRTKSQNFWSRVEELRNDPNGNWGPLMDKLEQMVLGKASSSKSGYAFPTVSTSLTDTISYMPFINSKWLDVVKKSAPTTPSQLIDVLRAFRDTDCNGNNIDDEIPIAGYTSANTSDVISWLINFFVYCQDEDGLNIRDGKLYLPQADVAYKDAMDFIQALVSEKLLLPGTFDSDISRCRTNLGNGDCVGIVVGDPTKLFITQEVINSYEALDLLGYVSYEPDSMLFETFITAGCENVDAAWELLMLMCTEEAAIVQYHGTQGEEWKYSDGTIMTEYGIAAEIELLKETRQATNRDNWYMPHATFSTYKIKELAEDANKSELDTSIEKLLVAQYKNHKAAYERWTLQDFGEEHICPWLNYNAEEAAAAVKRDGVMKVVQQWTRDVAWGFKDPDTSWQAYLNDLEVAGLSEYLNAAQQCYDRMCPNGHTKE